VKISRGALAIAAVATALHLALSNNYGLYRDEFYFIDCARHLAWGYVDQPPLVPFLVSLAAPFGFAAWAVRFFAVLASGATILGGALIVRELGGKAYAQTLAALAIALAPGSSILASALSTSSFESVTWTFFAYLTIRIVRGANPRWFLGLGIIAAFALYCKYSIEFEVFALGLALVLTRRRRALATGWLIAGAAICVALLLPNAIWEGQHGFPILQVLHADALNRNGLTTGLNDESSQRWINAGLFTAMQIVYQNPILAVVWIWGLIWLGFNRAATPFRYLALAYVLLFVTMIWLVARPYYLVGYYPILDAAGAVAIAAALERALRWRIPLALALGAVAAIVVPFMMPLLPLPVFNQYAAALGIRKIGPSGRLLLMHPLFADEIGWRETTAMVAGVYRTLPQSERAQTAIFADTYGLAGAIDLYGSEYGLPPAISGHENYWLWGPRDYTGDQMIAVGASNYHLWVKLYRSVRQVAVYRNDDRWTLEGPLPIYLLTGPRESLAQMWPSLKRYGL
jgi:hypothetical protein